MNLNVALERTEQGSWRAHVVEMPAIQAVFGRDRLEAIRHAQAAVLRFLALQLEDPLRTATPRDEMTLAFTLV